MKILITGSKGYIGSTIYDVLKNKFEVVGLDKEKLNLINSNQVKKFFQKKYFDIVIHCAITGGNRLDIDDSNILDNNLKIFYNLLECESSFGKFIHFGSGAEKQDTFYGLSKKVINQSIKNKDKFHNIRILNVFDENELDTKFIKTNIRNYIDNKSINIFQNKHMDFFYMKDFIILMEYCIDNNIPKEIDCCYNYSPTLYDVAQIINNLDNYKVNIEIENWDMAHPFNGKFIDLGLKFIGLEQGIKNVYDKLKNEY
jgi:dTDP-4-dehydrorhamnose reductase